MTDDSFDITYAAHTATCTFLLDAEGICRRIVMTPTSTRSLAKRGRDIRSVAARCVGAQYVAALDPAITGMLADKPRVGASMLFARIDERGRVSLVRTGIVTKLEAQQEDPFAEPEHAPSTSVETSAPPITPSAPTPRFPRKSTAPADPYEEGENDRTQQLHALRPETLLRPRPAPEPEPRPDEHPTLDRATFDVPEPATARRPRPSTPELGEPSTPALGAGRPSDRPSRALGAERRTTWPSPRLELGPPPPTLRQTSALVADDEHDPYAALARGPLPRPTAPAPRMRSDRVRTSAEPSLPPIERISVRRRGGVR